MSVTLKDVEHIAMLARLSFTAEEKEMFTRQLNTILEYIDKLNRLDTSKVEPLRHVNDVQNVFRDDVVQPGLSSSDALANAPARTEEFFKVPKVIGEKGEKGDKGGA
ncbi:MAG: asparaginyl/glutamyl-tRNA amidotransferase subunit C [Ignavibacteria bacterium GWA2_55_11]|nr:MAG: asparaginyl/glutamyl-tRNA amidotransferase subunit C [Ignavibacteria bacterium GWA2_55_11]OGU43300.1 MAG: asparaginyl/glutamyl-tRNA amidotransferase subunit C [Ignavibacteria bacterium GWC2_56_12]HAV23409.1 Asp-tRNA(Asn)/Glu-tRNA(Gln) amidotransferase subunit GatB [Bacteroidota bacterium]